MAVLIIMLNPLTAKIFNWNFRPVEVASLTRSTTSSEWKLFRFDEMEISDFEILLINVKFHLKHV